MEPSPGGTSWVRVPLCSGPQTSPGRCIKTSPKPTIYLGQVGGTTFLPDNLSSQAACGQHEDAEAHTWNSSNGLTNPWAPPNHRGVPQPPKAEIWSWRSSQPEVWKGGGGNGRGIPADSMRLAHVRCGPGGGRSGARLSEAIMWQSRRPGTDACQRGHTIAAMAGSLCGEKRVKGAVSPPPQSLHKEARVRGGPCSGFAAALSWETGRRAEENRRNSPWWPFQQLPTRNDKLR